MPSRADNVLPGSGPARSPSRSVLIIFFLYYFKPKPKQFVGIVFS